MSDPGTIDPTSWIGKVLGPAGSPGVAPQAFLDAVLQIVRALNAQTQEISTNPPKSYTFAALPTVNFTLAVVTDSNTNVWGAAIAGGGANTVLAWRNAAGSWTVIGK